MKKKMRTNTQKTFLFFLLLSAFTLRAQVNQSLRIEYPIDDAYDHHVIPITDQQRALVVNKVKDRSTKTYNWSFDLIDDNLKVVKKAQMDFPIQFDYQLHNYYNAHYYLLLYYSKKGEYNLVDIDVTTLSYQVQKGVTAKGLRIEEFLAMDGTVFISAFAKRNHFILTINASTNAVQEIIPKELTDLKITYSDMQRIDNVASAKEMVFKYKTCEGGSCDYLMLRFNNAAKQIGNFFFLPKADAEKEITSITISKLDTDLYLATGTYSVAKSKRANGIYISRLNNGKVEFINYYNFLDLNNFTSYLSKKQQEKIEDKKDKKQAAGEELNLNYYVTVHDITVQDGEYFFLGEFYYPTYRTESYTTMGANGSMVTSYRTVFDGYQYSHASVAGFDMTGKLIWSNTFEMWVDRKPFYVKQFVRMNHEGENTKLIYATGSKIKTVTFRKNDVVKDESISILKPEDENDVVRSSYNNQVDWWFGQNYIGYGNQYIKNKEAERGERKREVFYINKISY